MTGLNVQPPLPPSRAHLRGFPSLLLAFLAQMRTERACALLPPPLSASVSRGTGLVLARRTLCCDRDLRWGKRNVTQRKSFEFRRFCLIGDLGFTMRSGGGVGGGGGDSTKATMQSLFKGKPILPASVPSSLWGLPMNDLIEGRRRRDAQKWT